MVANLISNLSTKIINEFIVRKSRNQKGRFIEVLTQALTDDGHLVRVEETKGLIHNRNIVVGDIERAKVICTAHYDTPAVLPLPNLIAPKNLPVTVLYQFFLAFLIIIPIWGLSFLANVLLEEPKGALFLYCVLAVLLLYLLINGPANKSNSNDNTSGVVTLIELLSKLSPDERSIVACVFFDNEEKGLIGSLKFSKRHSKQLSGKLIVNFDCVSDGDTLLMAGNRIVRDNTKLSQIFASSFVNDSGKEILFTSAFYPSDNLRFGKNMTIAIGAMRKSKWIGLYLSRIHTSRDVMFDEKNIETLSGGMRVFLKTIGGEASGTEGGEASGTEGGEASGTEGGEASGTERGEASGTKRG